MAAAARAPTAFAAVADLEHIVPLLNHVQAATGGAVSAFELVPRIGLAFVLKHVSGARDPLPAPSPWYVLIEIEAGAANPLESSLATALAGAGAFISDAAIASNDRQRADFWLLRERLSEAQKPEGGSIKHDISVPLSAIAGFIARASAAVTRACPGIRPVPFGHVGDGNVHFNLSQPVGADRAEFLARWEELSRIVHDIAAELGGSISAEHGLGLMKREEILHYKSATEIALMRTLKAALDPLGLMNPGKMLIRPSTSS
ncbi:MAG: FAD-linked oxidase C-terminal domain-containing protein [Alphaproteobacteria bacterium]